MKLFFFLGCAAAFLITTVTAATPALRGIIYEDDDDYPHLLDCLTHGSSSESACTSRDDCVWCTASCGCRGVCVSTHATSFFDDASDYTCPNNNDDDAVPTDDDTVPTDDDTVPTDDDNITPDTNYMDHLLECLAEGYPTNCGSHEGNTTCVWCHASPLDGMCWSYEAALDLSGYIFTCDFNTTTQDEDGFDKDEKHYFNEIRRPTKGEDTAKVDEVSVTNTKSSTKHYFNEIRRPDGSTTMDHEISVTDTNKRYFNEIRRPDNGQDKSDTTKHYFNEIRRRPTKKEGEVDGARTTDTKKYLNEVRRPTKDSTTPVALEEEM